MPAPPARAADEPCQAGAALTSARLPAPGQAHPGCGSTALAARLQARKATASAISGRPNVPAGSTRKAAPCRVHRKGSLGAWPAGRGCPAPAHPATRSDALPVLTAKSASRQGALGVGAGSPVRVVPSGPGLEGTHLPFTTAPAGSALLRCWEPTCRRGRGSRHGQAGRVSRSAEATGAPAAARQLAGPAGGGWPRPPLPPVCPLRPGRSPRRTVPASCAP